MVRSYGAVVALCVCQVNCQLIANWGTLGNVFGGGDKEDNKKGMLDTLKQIEPGVLDTLKQKLEDNTKNESGVLDTLKQKVEDNIKRNPEFNGGNGNELGLDGRQYQKNEPDALDTLKQKMEDNIKINTEFNGGKGNELVLDGRQYQKNEPDALDILKQKMEDDQNKDGIGNLVGMLDRIKQVEEGDIKNITEFLGGKKNELVGNRDRVIEQSDKLKDGIGKAWMKNFGQKQIHNQIGTLVDVVDLIPSDKTEFPREFGKALSGLIPTPSSGTGQLGQLMGVLGGGKISDLKKELTNLITGSGKDICGQVGQTILDLIWTQGERMTDPFKKKISNLITIGGDQIPQIVQEILALMKDEKQEIVDKLKGQIEDLMREQMCENIGQNILLLTLGQEEQISKQLSKDLKGLISSELKNMPGRLKFKLHNLVLNDGIDIVVERISNFMSDKLTKLNELLDLILGKWNGLHIPTTRRQQIEVVISSQKEHISGTSQQILEVISDEFKEISAKILAKLKTGSTGRQPLEKLISVISDAGSKVLEDILKLMSKEGMRMSAEFKGKMFDLVSGRIDGQIGGKILDVMSDKVNIPENLKQDLLKERTISEIGRKVDSISSSDKIGSQLVQSMLDLISGDGIAVTEKLRKDILDVMKKQGKKILEYAQTTLDVIPGEKTAALKEKLIEGLRKMKYSEVGPELQKLVSRELPGKHDTLKQKIDDVLAGVRGKLTEEKLVQTIEDEIPLTQEEEESIFEAISTRGKVLASTTSLACPFLGSLASLFALVLM